ncbi:diacylglycerol/lipid kinase family protein [Lentilactobacillus parakefiri]|uniref:Diacylglycerol kinase n=1 Tax=Lentilactobacillus parakefiri TaxID=152332 RepID=A0A269YMW9_9LACO|nr:diacylglycerol kinase family protein [Lentilactobacillus parakefiri]PAK86690.1 diacylglycerol kinase [Lentilactobacillus parakefiri]
MKYFIIINLHAGGDNAKKVWPAIQRQLAASHADYQTLYTAYPNHAIELSEQILDELDTTSPADAVLIAAGGDGTLHETLLGCQRYYQAHPHDHQVPIAFLPVGSGNDFARGLKIPLKWENALADILSGATSKIINVGHYVDLDHHLEGFFTNNLGIGFDATVVHLANKSSLKTHQFFGKFSYMAAILDVIIHFQGFHAEIQPANVPEVTFDNVFLLTTTDIPYFGGGINIVPTASVFDDHLDLVVVEKPSLWQLILFISMIFLKRHLRLKFIHHYHEKELFIKTNGNRLGQIDGEELGARSYNLKLNTIKYPFWVR